MIEQRYLFIEGSKVHNEFLNDLRHYSVTGETVHSRVFGYITMSMNVPDDTAVVLKLKYSKYLANDIKVTILKSRKSVDTKDSFQVKYD